MRKLGICAVVLAVALACGTATAATTSLNERFMTDDGVALETTVTGQSPLQARPTVVEFSPYGAGTGTFTPGPAYNSLLVQIRGTGESGGTFDALGPRSQEDVADLLKWACHQSWSNGRLALNGFSASAIIVYNSLHLHLPCVTAAILKSGTFSLYRDLLSPGGITNILPGAVVLGGIGGPGLAEGFVTEPADTVAKLLGDLETVLGVALHQTLDSWWQQRQFQGDVNHFPILMVDGFFDVESRGAFQAYQALRGIGAHVYVIGGHDGHPHGTDGGVGEMDAWLDHFVRGIDNGVERHPRVQLWLAEGSRQSFEAGAYVHVDASDWPVPGTTWQSWALSPVKSGTAQSLNDGSLSLQAPTGTTTQTYPAIESNPLMSDPPDIAVADASGLSALTTGFPALENIGGTEALGLTYTSPPLTRNLYSAGPAALDINLKSTAPQTDIWAAITDVAPNGTSHALAIGRLSTDYPNIVPSLSLKQPNTAAVVEPFGDYSHQSPDAAALSRLYQVEFWPIGNEFKAGDRIRLDIIGASLGSEPSEPALNTVTLGGPDPSQLLLPVLPSTITPS